MEYNNYITYSNECGSVRVELDDDGKPWFFATDIIKMLEGKADHTAYKMKNVAEDEKKLVKRLVKSGMRNVYLMNMLGFTTLSSESKCDKKRVEEISDLLVSAWNQILGDECEKIYGTESTEEAKAEKPAAVEKPLEEVAEGETDKLFEKAIENLKKKVEEEKATVEEKQVVNNNNFTVFENSEFGAIRTEVVNGEPWFCLADVCKALELTAKGVKQRLSDEVISNYPIVDNMGRTQEALFVNEDGLYDVILESRKESARKFRKWVTGEVLPSIRKTGSYQMKPLTALEQIQVIAKGTVELAQKVEKLEQNSNQLERNLNQLEHDMPLYGCEIDEVQQHVKRKGVQCLGGKDSEAYRDASLRGSVYSDIYSQLKREYGCVSSYKSIKRRYIADVHEFIDCYQLPTALGEEVDAANAQMRLQV